MSETWSAQLLITYEDKPHADPEANGHPVTLQVGVPKGRLQATEPNGKKHWLRLHIGEDGVYLPDIIAPTQSEVKTDGRRDAIIPGGDTVGKSVQWHVFLDGTTVDEYEGFLQRLVDEGCQPPQRHPPG